MGFMGVEDYKYALKPNYGYEVIFILSNNSNIFIVNESNSLLRVLEFIVGTIMVEIKVEFVQILK